MLTDKRIEEIFLAAASEAFGKEFSESYSELFPAKADRSLNSIASRAIEAEVRAEAQGPVALPIPPAGIITHQNLGELYDCLQMQQFAMKYAMLHAAPQPPAPCPKCVEHIEYGTHHLRRRSEELAEVCTERDALQAKVAEQSAEIERLTSECDTGQRRAEMAQRLHEDHYSTIAQQAERIAEMEAEAAENCRIIGMSGESEARHLAVITEQAALIEKCEKALRLVQKYAPITLDCEAFHHPKSMQHDSESTCEPAARYYHALNEVGKIIAAIAAQKGGAA